MKPAFDSPILGDFGLLNSARVNPAFSGRWTRPLRAAGLNELSDLATAGGLADSFQHFVSTFDVSSNVDSAASSSSTILSVAASMAPAHGHEQSLFGSPDPILAAGKSIAPFIDAGLKSSNALGPFLGDDTDFGAEVRAMAAKGWNVLDSSTIHQESVLPGFSPHRGILPTHDPRLPEETPESFAAQVAWAAQFLKVIDALPRAVFAYAAVEFFFLRPGIDTYQEDIQEDPTGIAAETIVVTGVRVAAFVVISVLVTVLFG
jgi:hypothetical protein